MARDHDLEQRIAALAEEIVGEAGAELVDVEVKGQKGSRVVRVYADADGGVDLDVIAQVSRSLGDLLEERDTIAGKYVLEVSSPGVDRPLRTATQLRRNEGRDLRVVRTREAIDRGEKGELTARLVEVTQDALHLRTTGKKPTDLTVPLVDVDHARVVLPF
jgi:ribosome maturation factor RimP